MSIGKFDSGGWAITVTNASKQPVSIDELNAKAFMLMESAQLLLDQAGNTLAAAHLDQALASILDVCGVSPRQRTNPPPTI